MRLNNTLATIWLCLATAVQADLVHRALPKCTASASKALSILKACPSLSASAYCNKILGTKTTTVKTTLTQSTTKVVTTTVSSGTTTITTTTDTSTSTTASTDTVTFIDTVMKRAASKSSSCNLSSSFKTYPGSIVTSACSCYKTRPVSTVRLTVTKPVTATATSTLTTSYTVTSTSTEVSVTTETDNPTVTTTGQCTATPTSVDCQAFGFGGGMIATCDLAAVPTEGQMPISTTAGVNLEQCGDLCCGIDVCIYAAYTELDGLCSVYEGAPGLATATGVAFMSYAS